MKHTAGAIFFRDRHLLLAKRAAHKAAYPNCWDVIGGHVDPGETVEQALIREAEEEVGLTPRSFVETGSVREPRPELHGEATHHFFVVHDWGGGEPQMLGDEHTEIHWFTIDEACALTDLALAEYRDLFRNLLPLA
jgi:8-oxo-dGTP pyrophosphatase MutT (NUDIX family)